MTSPARTARSMLHKAFLGECCPRETIDILSYNIPLLRMNVSFHSWGLLCSELPLLGTNPPTGVHVWVCAVSLLCSSEGGKTCSEVVNENLID